jgi:hypothetical protein
VPRGRHPGVREKNFSLTEVYGADEAFVTGTFAGVVPVRSNRWPRARHRRPERRADGGPAAGAVPRLVLRDIAARAGGNRMSTPLRIAMWSGPRNISTAMMRAWENREDCAVSDEPLYAHYLAPPAPTIRAATR